ncbi:MAG: prepilin-type N-terminal cleavage/methylation domain-containing protein [Candidatus Gracilibacteria bacterium]|nr:prepilin-type N-terminal cleavage/methylation domain-containing protein [Candidatus Gracilibacteria bacterium]
MYIQKKGFTLIEIMIGITIFSMLILVGFQALTRVNIGKIKLYTETDIEKQAFYFSEKMFEMIKSAGSIDYEEYFDRKVIGDTNFSSGHFSVPSGFGNFGSGGNLASSTYGDLFYYCLSGNGTSMGTGGCYDNNFNNYSSPLTGIYQRFGEYYYQFIDYNSNQNGDSGDEDGNGSFIGDDDDEYLGNGPEIFTGGTNIHELYLITKDNKKRTFFRWNVINDPKKPSTVANCDFTNPENPTGSGCLGNIQFLKLDGKDWGVSHNKSGTGLYDGITDTWLYDESIYGSGIIAGVGSDSLDKNWMGLFPDYINVKNVQFYVYPNKYNKYAWADSDSQSNIAPYIRINMILSPSRGKRGGIKGTVPEIKISTTIALNSF